MKPWGLTVKSGERLQVKLGGWYLRLRQASLGEVDRETKKRCVVYVIMDGKLREHNITTLDPKNQPQEALTWVIGKDFQIYHTLPNARVHLYGFMFEEPLTSNAFIKDSDDEGEGETSRLNKCLDIVARLQSFKKGSWKYTQAQRILEKEESVQRFFMRLTSAYSRIEFLNILIFKDD